MRGIIIISVSLVIAGLCISFIEFHDKESAESLRDIYSRPPSSWPKPHVDPGVEWTELGVLPVSPVNGKMDSLKNEVELGKILFFR